MKEYPVRLDIQKFLGIYNPFKHDVWGEGKITPRQIRAAVAKKNFNPEMFHPTHHFCVWTKQDHIRRIAHLVEHKSHWPIHVEPEFFMFPENVWGIYDGNHRFMAACVRGDDYIDAYIMDPGKDILSVISTQYAYRRAA